MKKIFLFFVFLDALHSFLEMKTGYNSRFLDCFSSGILCFVDLRFAKKYNFHSSSYIMREIWIPLLNIPMYIYISKISIIRIWGQKLFNVSRSTVFWKKERGRNVSISRFRLRNFRSNILFPTRDRIFPYRDSAHRNLPIEIFVLSRSSVARQDFSIIVRDKCRKVCVSEIKFLDFWSESVTTIQFRPRKKNAHDRGEMHVPQEKFLERNAR